ncbi:MAG: TIGR03086 family metal-binding protein [Ilumatobacteraceae bacterium]
MSQNLRGYTNSLYAFDHVLKLTPAKALNRKSPCDGWTGRDVVAHAIGGVQYALAAATGTKPPAKMPVVADDYVAQYVKLRDRTLAALDHPDVLHTVSETFFGPMPVDAFIGIMGADLAVHAWDLARTAKVDERLDPALVKATVATWKSFPEAMLRSPGVLGPKVASAKGADAQTRLLNFLGRVV